MQPAALPSGICQAGGRAKLSVLAVSYDVYPGVDLRRMGRPIEWPNVNI